MRVPRRLTTSPAPGPVGSAPHPQGLAAQQAVHTIEARLARVTAVLNASVMAEFSDTLRVVISRQDGVVTRRQLVDGGVSAAAVRWNSGRAWRVLLPHVVLLTREAARPRQRLVAGLLWAGERSVLAGSSAAAVHGITAADPRERVHLVVPAPLSSRRSGFAEVRRSVLHDEGVVIRGPLRMSSPARAAVDAARAARTEDTRSAILIEAVQRGLASVDDLAEWVHRLRTRDAAALRAPLEHAASGAWSVPESALLDLVATSAVLPPVWANPALRRCDGSALTTPDAWFDDVAMAVMVHSRRHHSLPDDWDATVEADAELVAAGVVVVGVTPRRIRTEPTEVLRRLERTYVAGRARPRPPVLARPRHLALSARPDPADSPAGREIRLP